MHMGSADEYLKRIKDEYGCPDNDHDRRIRAYAAMIAEEVRCAGGATFQSLIEILDSGERALLRIAERYGQPFARLMRRVHLSTCGEYLDIASFSLAWNKSPLYARQRIDDQQLVLGVGWSLEQPFFSKPSGLKRAESDSYGSMGDEKFLAQSLKHQLVLGLVA